MSSTSAPCGIKPVYHPSGQVRARPYTIASTYATDIFQNDPVKLTDNGVIQLGSSDGTRSGTVDGIALLGTLAGVEYTDATGKPCYSPYWPGGTVGTNIIAYVCDDPETQFEVQYANPSPGTTVQTAVGEECDWTVASPGGSTASGLSNTVLTAIQATSGQFQIVGFANNINDTLTDAYVRVLVRINEHHYKAAVNSV